MSHAEVCPVCQGQGKFVNPDNGKTTAPMPDVPCHGCQGDGWIMLFDEPPIFQGVPAWAPYWIPDLKDWV